MILMFTSCLQLEGLCFIAVFPVLRAPSIDVGPECYEESLEASISRSINTKSSGIFKVVLKANRADGRVPSPFVLATSSKLALLKTDDTCCPATAVAAAILLWS